MTKRILAIIACLAMILATSCSSDAPQLLAFIDPNQSDKLDFDGQKFYFFTDWEETYHIMEDYSFTPTLMLELKDKRFDEAETELNIDIIFTREDPILQLSTGYGTYELMDSDLNRIYDYYKSGILAPIEEVSTIDMSSGKWGNENFLKYGNFNGKQYGIFPWHWNHPEVTGAMMFNGELLRSFGGTIPYEFQEKGIWNWETFENEIRSYPKERGSTPLKAIHVQEFEVLGLAALHSNNLRTIEGNEEEGYTFGLNNNEAYETLDWLNSLYNDGLIEKASVGTFTVSNECVYYIGDSYLGLSTNMTTETQYAPLVMKEYGFITFPHGPNGTEKNVGAYTYEIRRLMALSDKANMEVDDIGRIANYLFEPVEGYTDSMWKTELRDYTFHSEECYENYLMLIENPEYNFGVQLANSKDKVYSAISNSITGIDTASVALDRISDTINNIAENLALGN